MGRDAVGWSQDVWDRIDKAVGDEARRSSLAASLLPLVGPLPAALTVAADVIAGNPLAIAEDGVRPLVELSVEFTLTPTQVAGEASLLTATSLATRAANLLAQAEDILIFQGEAGQNAPLFKVVKRRQSPGTGLVESAEEEIAVQPVQAGSRHYGEHLFAAVAKGCAHLQAKGQYGPYALALHDTIYADSFAPLAGTLVTPADRIKPLVTQGFAGTGALPPHTGVLVSVGGNTVDLALASDAAVDFSQVDGDGLSRFRVSERFALRVKERAAIVRLRFSTK